MILMSTKIRITIVWITNDTNKEKLKTVNDSDKTNYWWSKT